MDFGEESLLKRAHKEIEDVESAVVRLLMESSYAALTNKATAQQIYASNYPKVQSRLSDERLVDLETSLSKQPKVEDQEGEDICEKAMELYPNMNENKARIRQLAKYMAVNRINLL